MAGPKNKNVCHAWASGKKCRFGDSCRFSHGDTHKAHPQISRDSRKEPVQLSTSETELAAWKFLSKKTPKLLTVEKLSRFFQIGSKLIDTEAGVRQAVIITLDSEDGLRRVGQLVSQEYDYESLEKEDIFTEQINPLFQILTHPEVLASALNEQHIASICGYIYGVEGQRLVTLYGLVIEALGALLNCSEVDVYITIALRMLAKIIDMKTEAQVNERLHPLVNSLNTLIKGLNDQEQDTSMTEPLDLYEAVDLLARVQYRLGLGTDMLTTAAPSRAKASKAAFVMEREPPGGRHDNDFEDMNEIEIMPSYEEIISKSSEYLPHKDLRENHVQGLAGLFDRQFRLLREDTVGPIRESINTELDVLKKAGGPGNRKTNGFEKTNGNNDGIKTHSYRNLKIEEFVSDENSLSGFKFAVSFEQPARGGDRKAWWVRSQRLEPDALVCLVDSAETIIFCTVDQNTRPRTNKPQNFRKNTEDVDAEQQFSRLYSLPTRATVFLKLEDATPENVKKLLVLCRAQPGRQSFSLIEFPKLVLASFKPTLRALQEMMKTGDLALSQFIVPSYITDEAEIAVPPPAYTQKRGFRFNLRCLLKEDKDLFFTPGHPFDIKLLVEGSELDEAQAKALINTLCRCVGLIQGPPGTGKSYVGVALIRILLENRDAMRGGPQTGRTVGNDIGPIIIVTYTNHAGDQLGEHLHHAGVEKIIRIGGGSKSEVLQDCNLKVVSRKEQRTKHESWMYFKIHENRENEIDPLFEDAIDDINALNSSSSTALKNFILSRWPHHHRELFEQSVDADGFQQVRSRQAKNPQTVLRNWPSEGRSNSGAPRSAKVLKGASLASMSKDERYKLRRIWENDFQQELEDKLMEAVETQSDFKLQKEALSEETDLRCLRAANVIIMTTSGLAMHLNMLRKLHSRVLLCEEAGEVLEAHLLTTLLPSIEHAILIGDHEQLRPGVQNNELKSENRRGAQYSLDISLFERLVHPGSGIQRLPYNTLETQRRMHPSISQLVRGTLYPTLKDADNVKNYPPVVGMRKRLVWLDHAHLEADSQPGSDKTEFWNKFEVEMTTELVHHLVRQGEYGADEIAVITPYKGQLKHLRDSLSASYAIVLGEKDVEELENGAFEPAVIDGHAPPIAQATRSTTSKTTLLKALKLATVDNFQGEEAKVIVLSLVRSNTKNKIGFLKTSNRINVALSRAKHGMIIIGNASMAASSSEMWANVVSELRAHENIGPSLDLQCPRHPDTIIAITTPDDIPKLSPDGGCGRKCVDRMMCGHQCPARCHSKILHAAVHCAVPCPRSLKGCDHSCPSRCGDVCPDKCQVGVFDAARSLPCGHNAENLPCWQSQDVNLVKCMVKVPRTIPGCGHSVDELCHVDVDAYGYRCQVRNCNANLLCGHTCLKNCKDCTVRSIDGTAIIFTTDHGKCLNPCGRSFSNCSHNCTQPCHGNEPCPPCKSSCENSCSHSRCGKLCSEPCRPCAEDECSSGCEHSACSMPCASPCNHLPCSQRCNKLLSCGHQCPSICGESCPPVKFCQVCTKDKDVREMTADLIGMSTYVEIDLNETPAVFPPCGHFLAVETMDGHMSMSDHYETDVDGKIVGIKKTLSVPFSINDIKRCATCRGSLRAIGRYGRLTRRAMLDEATKRFIVWSNLQYIPLVETLQAKQTILAQADTKKFCAALTSQGLILRGSSEQQISAIRKLYGQPYQALMKLRPDIIAHRKSVSIEEQPFKKVLELVHNPRRRREGIVFDCEVDDSLLQTRAGILATSLLIRCELVIVSDVIQSCKRAATNRDTNVAHFAFDFTKNKALCEGLSVSAKASSNRLQEMEGHLFFAQYAALERQFSSLDTAASNELYQSALAHIYEAKNLKNLYGTQTRALHSELDSIEKMVNGGTFYAPLTSDEMRAVVVAMATEFSGTGHWYYCQNGHPFTIGECGMPMQTARCPQCDATIGGQQHRAVEGTTHAHDLEQQFSTLAV